MKRGPRKFATRRAKWRAPRAKGGRDVDDDDTEGRLNAGDNDNNSDKTATAFLLILTFDARTMRLSYFLSVLSIAGLASSQPTNPPPDTFHESLTLHPLPDGKLSVLFEFTTHFSLHGGECKLSRLSWYS